MGKQHYIIPVFVPHLGCPFDCAFCNQKKITGLTKEITKEDVEIQIQEYLHTIGNPKGKHIEIAFFGGSFTGIEIKKQRELLSVASKWKNSRFIKDIRLSTRPDYINQEIMEFLMEYGVSIIELGVQSMDDGILIKSGRGHTSQDVINAVKLMKKFNVKIGLQMMMGLPGDDIGKLKQTAKKIIDLSPDFVRIYPTLVVKNTHLEKMYHEGLYKPLELKEAVILGKELLLEFLKYKIPVIRIGLQPTENILLGREVLAGPFHPAFRQLVESEIFKDMLDYLFEKYNILHLSYVELEGNDGDLSSLVGQKRKNIEFIKNKYKIKRIRITRNNNLKNGNIKILIPLEREIIFGIQEYINNKI